jgi:hypothetical protein
MSITGGYLKHQLSRFLSFVVAASSWILAYGLAESTCNAQSWDRQAATNVQVLTPTQAPPDKPLNNPMSGLFTNLAQKPPPPGEKSCPTCAYKAYLQPPNPATSDAAPLPEPPVTEYGRLSWHTLEPSEGQFDFSVIENALRPCATAQGQTPCLPQGGRLSFRIMAFNPQFRANTNHGDGDDGFRLYSDLPDYIMHDGSGRPHGWLLPVDPADKTQGRYVVPDWNDPYFISRATALLAALGAKYDHDPRIGWVDIGLYGSWGEWHTAGLPAAKSYRFGKIPYDEADPVFGLNAREHTARLGAPGGYRDASEAAKEAIVAAHVRAFPDKQLVMMTDDGDGVCAALHAPTRIPIGLRRDSLGSVKAWNSRFPLDPKSRCVSPQDQALIANRWQIAPFIAEPFGNGSSQSFGCQTFQPDPETGGFAFVGQMERFHVAAIKNQAFCTGTWDQLTPEQQAAIAAMNIHAGYRLAPTRVEAAFGQDQAGKGTLKIATYWQNAGVAPTYDVWAVDYTLCRPGSTSADGALVHLRSRTDLRRVLPGPAQPHLDELSLPADLPAGRYELRLRVSDPGGYLRPMQLALADGSRDGSYVIGTIAVAGRGRR